MKTVSRRATYILLVLIMGSGVLCSLAAAENSRDAERIFKQAKEAERKQSFDQAIALYQQVITTYLMVCLMEDGCEIIV